MNLIIDTAHPTARIVLADDKNILGIREWENTPTVGTSLLIYIEELLKEVGAKKTSISRVGVHSGPGSYGLVRTGIVTGTMLAQSVGAGLVSLQGETVDELVENIGTENPVISIEPKYRDS
jgi:tRNA A37 threonylcarbamoyladenosine modification protein TsaB